VDDCIQALQYLPEHTYLLVAGVGEQEHALRELARTTGMRDRVRFFGFLPKEAVPLFLAVSDVFVRPSRSEGFGNSFIEAMAAGLPVVATPIGGIVDFIDDHETGVFCRPDNPKSVAEAVTDIVTNPDLRGKLVRQGKERAVLRYSWDVVVQDMKSKVFGPLLS
jgi:phosphatidylinositol alpha-1,6-mannosyltransferase